jgi:hypothetical protein
MFLRKVSFLLSSGYMAIYPEYRIPHNHRCDNLKSDILYTLFILISNQVFNFKIQKFHLILTLLSFHPEKGTHSLMELSPS